MSALGSFGFMPSSFWHYKEKRAIIRERDRQTIICLGKEITLFLTIIEKYLKVNRKSYSFTTCTFILLLQYIVFMFNKQVLSQILLIYPEITNQKNLLMKQHCYLIWLFKKSRAAAFISMVIALYVLGDDAMIISAHSLAFSLSFLSR